MKPHVRFLVDGARAAEELHDDGRRHEEAEAERNDGIRITHAAGEERGDHDQHADAGPLEVLAQAFHRRAAPGEERADAGQEEQEQADRHHQAVEPDGIEADLFGGELFRDDREHRAPENREATGQQNQIIEQEARFARNDAFQFGFALQVIEAVENQPDGGGDADGEEGDEVFSDGRFGERMHRADDAGARKERAVDAKEERGRR